MTSEHNSNSSSFRSIHFMDEMRSRRSILTSGGSSRSSLRISSKSVFMINNQPRHGVSNGDGRYEYASACRGVCKQQADHLLYPYTDYSPVHETFSHNSR